jgi:catechol 2,3-dioxygenase-like lactoylglutathione lyase family enzyme
VSVRIGEQLVDLVPDPNYDPQEAFTTTGFLHLCVRIDGRLSDFIPYLRERGTTLIEETAVPRMGATGQGLSIYVRDPDEYIVELKEDGNA